MNQPSTLYLSADYRILYKPHRVHYNEVLTQGEAEWAPVHRLDYETSGALLFSKPELVVETRKLFQIPGSVEKIYLAGASRALKSNKTEIEGFVASRHRSSKKVHFYFADHKPPRGWHSIQDASMDIEPVESDLAGGIFTGKLHQVKLLTGARHQIRAFFAAMEAPLVGDILYGAPEGAPRMELHAWRLSFEHPRSGEKISATATLLGD